MENAQAKPEKEPLPKKSYTIPNYVVVLVFSGLVAVGFALGRAGKRR